MYQALYRKWRPKIFDDVCGQEHITSILKYEVENLKISHAYLFCGSRGTGKTTCAKILSKAINCTSPKNGNPCGECAACLSIENGSATDVLEMDAASNNGVDNIRDIRDEVIYAPAELKYRVYIIDEVHMLSTSAFNALLKTLEEPPEHAVFILATTELHKLPATIISRCQRFDFRRITTDVLSKRLLYISNQEGIEIDKDASLTIARQAQGGMRDAISLLELCAGSRQRITDSTVHETVGIFGREKIVNIISAIQKKDYDVLFESVAEAVRSSKDLSILWQEIISMYRDLLIIKTATSPKDYLDLSDVEYKMLGSLASQFSQETLSYHCNMLENSLLTMQKASSIKRSVAEITLIRMCDPRLCGDTHSLIERISVLEEKLKNPLYLTQNTNSSTDIQTKKSQKAIKSEGRKQTPVFDDDEDFRSDSPHKTASSDSVTEKSYEQKRVLRPYRNRAEVLESLTSANPMIAPFFKEATWYTDSLDNIVLKFKNEYSITSIKNFGGDADFIRAVSATVGISLKPSQVLYESDNNSPTDDIIDEIINAADE